MLEIEIKIRNPFTMLLIIGGTVGLVVLAQSFVDGKITGEAMGGSITEQEQVERAETQLYRQRIEQDVLGRREEILRYQLRVLEEGGEEWNESRERLRALLMDQKQSEEAIRLALRQLWEAQGRALIASQKAGELPHLSWPVEPRYGLSARYLDTEYQQQFGIPHRAIDIPVEQESLVRAAADGVVAAVIDNGMGYNYLILEHAGGSTLYGHMLNFLVTEGQYVKRGDPIARSGGMPGTPGAGPLSTGPHVHFEVIADGVHVDPLQYLPNFE
ncbi:MAG: M23 family metallopeptidase [Candidatus Peribacteraceae bacterium]